MCYLSCEVSLNTGSMCRCFMLRTLFCQTYWSSSWTRLIGSKYLYSVLYFSWMSGLNMRWIGHLHL